MNDPLHSKGPDQQLFEAVTRQCEGMPIDVVWNLAINLIANSIRQTTAHRREAEARIDQLFAHAKTMLLDVHYDSVTGLRRGVIPYTQVLEAPFLGNGNKAFPPSAG